MAPRDSKGSYGNIFFIIEDAKTLQLRNETETGEVFQVVYEKDNDGYRYKNAEKTK